MFRFFENLVDPFSKYKELYNPPNTVRSFLMDYTKPFVGVFAITGVVATLAAASEIYLIYFCLLYTSPSPRDMRRSRMPSSA